MKRVFSAAIVAATLMAFAACGGGSIPSGPGQSSIQQPESLRQGGHYTAQCTGWRINPRQAIPACTATATPIATVSNPPGMGPPPGWNGCVIGCTPVGPTPGPCDGIAGRNHGNVVGRDINPCGGPIASGASCDDALEPNSSVNGLKDHGDMISGRFGIFSQSGTGISQEIGYEYQTYGGQEYFEPFITISVGVNLGPIGISGGNAHYPIIPFNGNFASALQELSGYLHVTASSLPVPLNLVAQASSVIVRQIKCQTKPGVG